MKQFSIINTIDHPTILKVTRGCEQVPVIMFEGVGTLDTDLFQEGDIVRVITKLNRETFRVLNGEFITMRTIPLESTPCNAFGAMSF